MNWSWKLQRLAMCTAMSLEPSEEYVDILCDILKESEQNDGRPLAEHENMVEQVYNTEA